jgi:hypothetical protein
MSSRFFPAYVPRLTAPTRQTGCDTFRQFSARAYVRARGDGPQLPKIYPPSMKAFLLLWPLARELPTSAQRLSTLQHTGIAPGSSVNSRELKTGQLDGPICSSHQIRIDLVLTARALSSQRAPHQCAAVPSRARFRQRQPSRERKRCLWSRWLRRRREADV